MGTIACEAAWYWCVREEDEKSGIACSIFAEHMVFPWFSQKKGRSSLRQYTVALACLHDRSWADV
jgi:hypothetical protein